MDVLLCTWMCPELLALDDGESFGGKVFMYDGSFSWVPNVDSKQTRAKINRAMKERYVTSFWNPNLCP